MDQTQRSAVIPAIVREFANTLPRTLNKADLEKAITDFIDKNFTIDEVKRSAIAVLAKLTVADNRYVPRPNRTLAIENKLNSLRQLNRPETRVVTKLLGHTAAGLPDDDTTIGEVYTRAEWAGQIRKYFGANKKKRLAKFKMDGAAENA